MATTTLSAALALKALHDHVLQKFKDANTGTGPNDTLPAKKLTASRDVKDLAGPLIPIQGKICIVGAGACGLYLALMLRYLGFSDFDILESSDRVGGRCYTHKFTDDAQCPHNYYDLGAMRIPDIDAMKRYHTVGIFIEIFTLIGLSTLNLITTLELDQKKVPYVLHDEQSLREPNMYWYRPLTAE